MATNSYRFRVIDKAPPLETVAMAIAKRLDLTPEDLFTNNTPKLHLFILCMSCYGYSDIEMRAYLSQYVDLSEKLYSRLFEAGLHGWRKSGEAGRAYFHLLMFNVAEDLGWDYYGVPELEKVER
jgi:hypothetical protein